MFETKTQTVDLFAPDKSTGAKSIPMTIDPKAMGKIMESLTKFYKNPIMATVRETVSNALDATAILIQRGENPDPVEIFSPSQLNPYFIVRDHGVGMTPELVDKVFAKYGTSTKELDAGQTGEFGFGAKSPLSYVDEFFFETTRDGYTTEVSVSRTDSGPLTQILRVYETSDKPGTTMRVPVFDHNEVVAGKFQEAIDNYRDYAFTMGQSVIVDGVLQESSKKYHLFDEIVLHEEKQTTGRVWLNIDLLNKHLKNKNDDHITFYYPYLYGQVDYVLSGFLYKSPNGRWREEKSLFLVELSPKLLNFSPSRDDIIDDDHYRAFEEQLSNKLLEKDSYYKSVLSYYRTLNKEDAYSLFSKLPVSKREDDGLFFKYEKVSYDYTLPDETRVHIDELTTSEGYNPFVEDKKYEVDAPVLGFFSKNEKFLDFTDFYRPQYTGKKEKNGTVKFEKYAITSLKDSLIANFNDDSNVQGLIKSISIIPIKNKLIANKENLAIVSVSDSKEISYILRNRNNLPEVSHFLLVRGEIKTDLKELFSSRISILSSDLSISYMNMDDVKESVTKNRALQKANNKENKTFRFRLYKKRIYSKSDVIDFKFNFSESSAVIYNVSEIKELSPIIFIDPSSDGEYYSKIDALNGLYENDGELIFDRPIMSVNRPRKDFYESLRGSSVSFVAGKNYKARSKIEEESLKDRRFNRSLQLDLANMIPLANRKKIAFLYNLHKKNRSAFSSVEDMEKLANSVHISNLRKWGMNNQTETTLRFMNKIEFLLNHEDIKEDLKTITVSNVLTTLSKEDLTILEKYATIAFKISSLKSSFYMDEIDELIALLIVHTKTESDVVRSAVFEQIDRLIAEAIN